VLSDYFNEICQFCAGIEIYPLAFRVSICQTPGTFALNPCQIIVGYRLLAGLVTVRMKLGFNFHDRPPLARAWLGVKGASALQPGEGAEQHGGCSLWRTG
jgi:hypothetical protein